MCYLILSLLYCFFFFVGMSVESTGYHSIVTNYFKVHYEPVFARSSWGRAVLPFFPSPGLLVVASLQPQLSVFLFPHDHQL